MAKIDINKATGRPLKFKSVEELKKKIEDYYDYCEMNDKPLTLSRLAVFLEIDRATLYNYSQREPFFDTIKNARERVQADMEERALANQSNSTFSIFSLKNNFGWTNEDKVITENTNLNKNVDLSNISTEDLKRLLENED